MDRSHVSRIISDDFWEYSIDIVRGDDIYTYIDNLSVCGSIKEELSDAGWDESVHGRSVILPDGNIFVWLNDACGYGTIAHEAVHVTRHILHNVQGIPLTDETEEVYARMVGSIVSKIT
jgi:hypothetical protein